jgi:hypothetical protein
MFALPLGQSLIYVGVPYIDGQGAPNIYVATYATGSEPPSCTSASFVSTPQWAVAPYQVDINADYLGSHHYLPSYNKRAVGILDVPEGTNLVVCAMWYDTSVASFDRSTPSRYQSLLVSSPDTATPVFTLQSIRTVQHVAQGTLTVTGATLFGNICGTWFGPDTAVDASQTIPANAVLCDRGGQSGGGSTNAFQVSTSYVKPDGNRVNSSAVIRMPSVLCTGADCALPPDSTYDVVLPTVTVATGMCGSSFGAGCTPPTSDTSLGVATVALHWVAGASNGNTAWSVGNSLEATPTAPRPDSPQFDVYNGWAPALSTDGGTGSASLSIRTDRQANYTITVSGDCWKGTPPAPITGRASTATGIYFTATASLTGLCPGTRYSSTIELVDDAGHRTLASTMVPTASIAPTAYQDWGGGDFTVPQDHLVVSAHVEVLHGYPLNQDWGIMGADLTVGASRWPNTAHFDQACHTSAENNIPGTMGDQTVPLTDTIHLKVAARYVLEGLYNGHEPSAPCAWTSMSDYAASQDLDVTPSQLVRGVLIHTDFHPDPNHETPGISEPSSGSVYVWVSATRVSG